VLEEQEKERQPAEPTVTPAHQAWQDIDQERRDQLLQAALRKGGKSLNASRLNIVGEGCGGKTTWLAALSNRPFQETWNSTIGVQQSLLEVDKIALHAQGGGSWTVVEGSGIITAEEAQLRLAAQMFWEQDVPDTKV
jgi:hypothetical protein